MAYNFPDSPSNGDTFTLNGVTYTYNSTKGVWKDTAVGTPPPPSVTSSDTAPANPSAGDLWYRTDDSTLYVYYNDGSSSQWVGVSGPAGPAGATGAAGADGADGSSVVAYANFAAVPTSGNTVGDFAFTSDTKALYMWDGAEWDRVALGNDESPVITTEPSTTHELNGDGTTSTVTMVAQDPEGFDITYGIAYKTTNNARPSQLSADTTINQSTGVYTFTPTTTQSNAGSFRARLSASDGARITTRFVDFSLAFYPAGDGLLARYEFYNTNSYNPSTSTTALNDNSGNGNNQTISNPGTHTGSGNLTFTGGSTSISFSGLTSAKAWCIIYYPTSGWDQTLLFSDGLSSNNYYATFQSNSNTPYSGGYSAHSGATIVDRVNGTNPTDRQVAYNAMDISSMNSIINSGTNMSAGMSYNTYNQYNKGHLVRAMVFFDRELTLAEMEELHNHYRDEWIAAGGTMPTWGN